MNMTLKSTDKERCRKLFRYALAVLEDRCPFEEQHQLCRENEDYYDGVCYDCWSSYLYKVVNGEEKEKKP